MTVTVPVPITFTAGSVLTAANLNSDRDALTFLLSMPRCILTRSVSTQSIPNSSNTTVSFDTVVVDPYNMSALGTSATNINCLAPGTYRIGGHWYWASNVTGNRQHILLRNGTSDASDFRTASSGSVGDTLMYETELVLNDILTMQVSQTSGGALTNFGTSALLPRLSVTMVATS